MLGACSSSPSEGDDTRTANDATLPAIDCAAGTMPVLGSTSCAPVGTTACAEGFAPSSSGWGCDAISIATACTGPTRAKLGEPSACVAIDDCAAPFPPATSFAVVKSAAELEDALAKAPRGATIALDEGQYGAIKIEQDVTLVGRCASRVRFVGPGARGIQVVGENVKAKLRSLSVSGFEGGVVSSYGSDVDAASLFIEKTKIGFLSGEATMTVSSSVVEGNAQSQNALNTMMGGLLTATDVELRGTQTAIASFDPKSSVVVKRSIVTYEGANQKADLLMALRGGDIRVEESLVRTRASSVLFLGKDLPGIPAKDVDRAGRISFVRSNVRQVDFNREGAAGKITSGGSVSFEESTFEHQSFYALMAGDAESKVTLTNSVLRSAPTDDFFRSALFITGGASSTITGSAIVNARQSALLVAHPGSSLTLDRSLVANTEFRAPGPNAETGGSAIAVGAGDQASLIIKDSAIVKSQQFGVFASDAALVEIRGSVVDGAGAIDDGIAEMRGGDAIVIDNQSRLAMESSVVRGSGDAALMLVGGDGIVDSCRFVNNRVGLHLSGTKLRELSASEPAPSEPGASELVLRKTSFEATDARVRESDTTLPTMTMKAK